LIRRGVTLAVAVATLKATRVTASQIPQDLIAQTMSTCCGPELSSNVASAAANPATQLALEELNVMNAILISKPLAIACLVTAAATLAIGAQLAVSQSPSDRGGSTITLDTHAELVAADSPNGQLNLAQRRDDTSPTGTSGELSLNDFEITSQPQNGESLTLSDERLGIESSATENSFFDSPERTPNRFDVKSSTPIENKIRKTLTRAISGLDFHETPLEDIVGFLQDECEIPIQLDRRALDDEGFGVDEPVTILLRGVKLESALRLMLRDLQLTYTVQDEVLLITTESVAASTLETRVYPVADLELKTDSLKDVITATVATESWSVNGGGESEIRTLGDALVISTTYAIHEEIQQLFQQLQDLNRQ
jgi:hypothetical protein